MHGNVLQWVQDCFAPDYLALPTDGSGYEKEVRLKTAGDIAFMSGTSSCAYRRLRGGDWAVGWGTILFRETLGGRHIRSRKRRKSVKGAAVAQAHYVSNVQIHRLALPLWPPQTRVLRESDYLFP